MYLCLKAMITSYLCPEFSEFIKCGKVNQTRNENEIKSKLVLELWSSKNVHKYILPNSISSIMKPSVKLMKQCWNFPTTFNRLFKMAGTITHLTIITIICGIQYIFYYCHIKIKCLFKRPCTCITDMTLILSLIRLTRTETSGYV